MNIKTISFGQLKNLLILVFCMLLSFKLMDYSMLYGNLDFINNNVAIFIAGIVVILCNKRHSKHRGNIFFIMLFVMLVSTFMRKESEYYLTNVLGILGIAAFYNIGEDEYRNAVYGIAVGAFPYLFLWLRSFIVHREYLGNRGPLCFSVIGFLLVTVLMKRKKTYAFVVVIFNILICLFGSSRTSMLCNIGCFFLMLLDMWRGKLTRRRVVIILLSVIAVAVGFSLMQDKIVELIVNKWGRPRGESTLLSNRELLWMAALSDFKMWGYPSTYVQSQFNYANIHNSYIQSYVSFGVIVGVLYVIWSVMILVKGIKSRNSHDGIAFLIPMIAITVTSMFESTFIMDTGYPLLGLCVVLISGQIERISSMNQNKQGKGILHVQS